MVSWESGRSSADGEVFGHGSLDASDGRATWSKPGMDEYAHSLSSL